MSIKYIITESIYHNGALTRTGYGIAAITEEDGITTVLKSVNDLTPDKAKISELVSLCNTQKLSAIHLYDVAEDFAALN